MAEKRAVTDESEEKLIVVTPQPGAVIGASGDIFVSTSDSLAADAEITDGDVAEQDIASGDDEASGQQASEEGATPIPPRDLLFEVDETRVYISLTINEHRQRFVPATGIVVPVGVKG